MLARHSSVLAGSNRHKMIVPSSGKHVHFAPYEITDGATVMRWMALV
jgi:hypothetical protein